MIACNLTINSEKSKLYIQVEKDSLPMFHVGFDARMNIYVLRFLARSHLILSFKYTNSLVNKNLVYMNLLTQLFNHSSFNTYYEICIKVRLL